MSAEDNKALIRRLYDAANARDYDTLREHSTPEIGEWLVGAIRSSFERFDAPWEVLDVLGDGDKVAVQWRREGVHNGSFMGVPANGQRISMDGVRIWRFENGKLAESFAATNQAPALRQLGVLPPAQEGAARA